MKRINTPIAALLICSATASSQVVAAGWTDRISIGGFASTNYSRTNSETPFNGPENIGHDDKGSWAGTRVGLNVNAAINKRFRFASQLYSFKAELSQVKTDKGVGLFLPTSTPASSVNMISFGLDTVF